jgi:hypothetical protein
VGEDGLGEMDRETTEEDEAVKVDVSEDYERV